MGQVKIQVTLRNAREVVMARLGHLPTEQVHTYTAEALVDTGATRLTVPTFVADQLGIIRLGHTDAEYADGRIEEVDTTEGIQIEMLGRTAIRDAMVLGKHVLIGVTVLEDLDLLVDCKRQRVMPPPDRPGVSGRNPISLRHITYYHLDPEPLLSNVDATIALEIVTLAPARR